MSICQNDFLRVAASSDQAVNRVLGDFFGELVTTWPAVTEACHMIPDHLAPVLLPNGQECPILLRR